MVRIVPLEDDSDWVQCVHPLLGNLEDFQDLPADFPFDFSAASLTALDRLIAERGDDGSFERGARAYAGETLMRIGGGRWVSTEGHPLAIRFDEALDLPGLPLEPLPPAGLASVAERVATAVARRRADDPGWEPAKQATPGVDRAPEPPVAELTHWLAGRRAAFATWSATRTETWDFSEESLDALERIARAGGAIPPELAEWYLGETLIRVGTGSWYFRPVTPGRRNALDGHRFVRPAPPGDGVIVPALEIADLPDEAEGHLRRALTLYRE
jgi:hypothetical protein